MQNNNAICNYDGGDCCPNSDLIRNDECDHVNYNHVCHFDGGDCCFKYVDYFFGYFHEIGNGLCTFFHNVEMCDYDRRDCCDSSRIADGVCDDTNNNRMCQYDGGDCCYGNKNTNRCTLCECIEVFNVSISGVIRSSNVDLYIVLSSYSGLEQ